MNVFKQHLRKFLLWYLIVVFFLLRLWNLTLLPIFNDEAIYIHWGIKELQSGNLYYSLYDSKQPLLMWFFAIFSTVSRDPLWGARLVSVLFGLVGTLGLFTLGKKFFSRTIGLWAVGLYMVIPIFSFFDRQALMETAVGVVGVWFVYFSLSYLQKPSTKHAVMLGILGGLGEFIKTSSLLFVVAFIMVLLWKRKIWRNIRDISYFVLSFVIVDSLLFINPMFWQTLSSNSRYSLTIDEIMRFPIAVWYNNIEANGEIILFYLTPLVVVGMFWGMRNIWLSKAQIKKLFLWLVFLPIILETFLSKSSTQRYLVSFLPLLTICTAVGIDNFLNLECGRLSCWGKKAVVIMGISLSTVITSLQISNPVSYFQLYSHLTRMSDIGGYLSTQNSGEGIARVVSFLKNKSSMQPIIVATTVNTGNPEDALYVYLSGDKNINFIYLDNRFLGIQLATIDCLSSSIPLYFISRDEQQGGMNQYLQQIESIHNPYGENRIGIYTLKQKCSGKTIRVD